MRGRKQNKHRFNTRSNLKIIGFVFILLMLPLSLFAALQQTVFNQRAQTVSTKFYAATSSKCFYQHISCPTASCHGSNCPPCGDVLVCPSTIPLTQTPTAQLTLTPTSPQQIITTAPQSPSPVPPTQTPPPGCYYSACTRVCPVSDPNCCQSNLLCPSITPDISPVCIQRPACLDAQPSCDIADPPGGWCPPISGIPQESQVDTLLIYLNTLLRNLLGIHK